MPAAPAARITGGNLRESAAFPAPVKHRAAPPGTLLRQSASCCGPSPAAGAPPPTGSGGSRSVARGLSRALFCPPGAGERISPVGRSGVLRRQPLYLPGGGRAIGCDHTAGPLPRASADRPDDQATARPRRRGAVAGGVRPLV